MYVQTYLEVT